MIFLTPDSGQIFYQRVRLTFALLCLFLSPHQRGRNEWKRNQKYDFNSQIQMANDSQQVEQCDALAYSETHSTSPIYGSKIHVTDTYVCSPLHINRLGSLVKGFEKNGKWKSLQPPPVDPHKSWYHDTMALWNHLEAIFRDCESKMYIDWSRTSNVVSRSSEAPKSQPFVSKPFAEIPICAEIPIFQETHSSNWIRGIDYPKSPILGFHLSFRRCTSRIQSLTVSGGKWS